MRSQTCWATRCASSTAQNSRITPNSSPPSRARVSRGRRLEEVYRPLDENSRQALPNPVVACLEGALAGAAASGDGPLAALTSRHGTEAGIEQTVTPIRGIDGRVLGVVLVFRDVTDRRRMAREMSYRATHDVLTGLVNRTDFESRLLHTLKLAHADGSVHALMFIDLDQFKELARGLLQQKGV